MSTTVEIVNLAPRAQNEPLRSLAFGGITTSYAALGAPLANASLCLTFCNTVSAAGAAVGVSISIDGVNAIMYLPGPTNGRQYYLKNMGSKYPAGTQFYVKSDAGSLDKGEVTLETIYG
jgi:hypothetical protein